MPRKSQYQKLKEKAGLDPVFAAEWKAKKSAEDKARRDAKLTPEHLAARAYRREHSEEHRKAVQRAAEDRRKAKRKAERVASGRKMLKEMTPAERKDYNRDMNRKSALKEAGWTLESFETAKQKQGNRCAICKEVPVQIYKDAAELLVPDHKHTKPPIPRALLCVGCNAGLGSFKDSPEICEAAADYLRRYDS
jgi:hypothetical protein